MHTDLRESVFICGPLFFSPDAIRIVDTKLRENSQ